MLHSPGHSPRLVASPERDHSPSPATGFATGNQARRRSKVLDEDSYVAAIEKIIERDFFPDIPKLRDRLDWLDAVKTGDPLQIRDAQLKIIERRRGVAAGENSERQTNWTTTTPGSTFARNFTPFDDLDPRTTSPGFAGVGDGAGPSEEAPGGGGVDASLSLDEFFRRYTSKDNDSFSKILEKVNWKREERYNFYLTEGDKGTQGNSTKRDRITDGFGTSDQPLSTLESWNYTAKNLLMYHPADRGEAPLTIEERANRMKALEKEINRSNTRFHGKTVNSMPDSSIGEREVLYAPVASSTPIPMDRNGDKAKKYDLDDLRKTPKPNSNPFYIESGKKSENGYGFVRTPSPAPLGSPFVTWGEIEGTPMRLEDEETPIDIGGSADGPRYRVPMGTSRDVKAHSLSRDAARKIRERSSMFKKPPLHSPVVNRSGSASPGSGVRSMSRAAQKFVRSAMAKKSSSDFDETLRASYRGSSPGVGTTPKSVSRLGRESARTSRSPYIGEGSNLPW